MAAHDDTLGTAADLPADGDWQRARRPEQKAERRRAILAATKDLIDEVGVQAATLSAIARRAELSKANCYRYFESREAILLELTLTESSSWMGDVEARLAPLAGSLDLDAVARAFVDTIVARPRLCDLYSAIYSVMERNVSPPAVADFKTEFHDRVFGSGESIRCALPELTTEDVDEFILFLGFFVAGAWPSANPEPGVTELLEERNSPSQTRDFAEVLLRHSRLILRGLLDERREALG